MKFLCMKRDWDPLEILNRQMNRLLDLELESHELIARHGVRYPLVNLMQTPGEYIITVELPGISPEEIKLEVTEDSLRLAGERVEHADLTEDSFRRQERWMGEWSRVVDFPKRTNPDSVTAEMADGVLEIRIAKVNQQKPRQIAIVPRSSG